MNHVLQYGIAWMDVNGWPMALVENGAKMLSTCGDPASGRVMADQTRTP